MNKRLLLLSLPIFLSLSILFLTVSPTFAENDSTDPIYNPENRKYYQFVQDIGISWNDAEINAKKLSHGVFTGQLAVITTQDQNDFITDLLPDESSAWIGLKASDEGFKWINEETFDYSNWSSYQPTNGDYEDYVELFEYNGKWNDTVNGNHDITGYVVEYSKPISEPTPENSPNIYPEYYNGSYYYFICECNDGHANDPLITWDYAKNASELLWYEGMQGHLVTITDEEESDFVSNLLSKSYPNQEVNRNASALIGLSDVETEGELKWVTGEPFEFSLSMNSNSDNADIVQMSEDGIYWWFVVEDEYSHRSTLGYMVEFSP